MSRDQANDEAPSPLSHIYGRRARYVFAAILLTIYFFAPATAVLDVTLDASNYGTYSSFTATGRQYGADILPMAGPYGFVMYGWTYAGQLYGTRLVLELLIKFAFVLLVLWLFRDTPGRWLRWIWLAALILVPHGAAELIYDFTVLFAGLYLILNYSRSSRLASSCAATALLALLALSKGTLLILATALLGLVALQAVASREFRRLIWLVATFVLTLGGCWLAAGQDLSHLPGFAQGISELSRGYNEAMGLPEPRLAFVTGLSTALLLGGFAGLLAWQRRREPAGLAAALLLAAFSFLKWKHGFVRADGHVYIFYQYAVAAFPTIWLLFPAVDPSGSRRFLGRWLPATVVTAGLALALYGPGDQPLARFGWQIRNVGSRLHESLTTLASPLAARGDLEARLRQNREAFNLPDVRHAVGGASIDFFGYEHGYLALNGLNYQPRPMGGGSFNVFTPYLQERNARHVSDPATRPDFFLVNLQTIDNRLLAQDDAATLRALIAGYRPMLAEQGMLLLHADPRATASPAPRRLELRHLRFGESVALPAVSTGEMLLATFELPPTWRGRLRASLYKPSPLYLSLGGDGLLAPESRRLVPSLVQLPVILSPALERTTDLLTLYSGEPGKTVHNFRLSTEQPADFDQARLSVTFYAAPRPAPISSEVRHTLAGPLDYPMSDRPPLRIVPPNQVMRVFDGLPVQMLETPGQLVFPLEPNDRVVAFTFGLDPECYTRGVTDGVDFFAELQAPGVTPVVLYRQPLHPVTIPADRGPHRYRLVLPPMIKPGSTLALHTDPGAHRDSAWDWAYYSGIHFESGPYVLEQFPGFNVVADEVQGDYCGTLVLANQHAVFMLNAPGRLSFPLDGRARSLTFNGGLLEGAYTEGNTDGAEFIVELRHPDGRIDELLRRWVRPKTVASDRGRQTFTVALPPHAAGDRLDLRTTGGPAGNLAWDWCYLDGLELH